MAILSHHLVCSCTPPPDHHLCVLLTNFGEERVCNDFILQLTPHVTSRHALYDTMAPITSQRSIPRQTRLTACPVFVVYIQEHCWRKLGAVLALCTMLACFHYAGNTNPRPTICFWKYCRPFLQSLSYPSYYSWQNFPKVVQCSCFHLPSIFQYVPAS